VAFRSRRRRHTLQRLFLAFPSGTPGIGLLILRASVGVTLVAQGTINLSWRGHQTVVGFGVALVLLMTGMSLLVGLLTPILSPLAGLECLGISLSWFPLPALGWFESKWASAETIAMCVAICFLGPGAFSLDARLFGWREIVIPPAPRNPKG
jgi:hypothetical protein